MRLWLPGLLLGLAASLAWANQCPAASTIRFAGEVSRGQSFEKKLWNDLVFVLKATDSGWDISVSEGRDAAADFVRVATPPYRFDNPRYLGTVYGHSAAEAAAWTPRGFSFATSEADHARADDAVRKLLWPSGLSEAELRTAETTLAQLPKGNGLLQITGAKLSLAKDRIDSLAFAVEIRPPVDPHAALRRKFLRQWPEYRSVEEACPDAAAPIRIGKAYYHDFDGDGFDEAVVLAHSCLAGTGGADLPGVFTRSASGEVIELEIGGAPGDAKLREGLRGKMDLKMEGRTLVKEFPVYREGGCPSGGVRRFSYRWDGKAFVLDRVEDQLAEPNP